MDKKSPKDVTFLQNFLVVSILFCNSAVENKKHMPKKSKIAVAPQDKLAVANSDGQTQAIEHMILNIRGQQVMLDRDLAMLYGVTTSRLNEQVRRNIERFPEDFMFQLSPAEFSNLKSQIATSNSAEKERVNELQSQNATASSASTTPSITSAPPLKTWARSGSPSVRWR